MAKSGKASTRKPTPKAKSGKQSKAKVISKKASPVKSVKASPAKKASKGSKIKWVAPFEKKITMFKTQGDYFARNKAYAGM